MTEILVDDFGPLSAKGDGTTDDTAAIQLAIDAGIASNRPVRFGARSYAIKREIVVNGICGLLGTARAGSTQREGVGDGRTVLRAAAPLRSVLRITDPVQLDNMNIEGKRYADYGMLLHGCSESSFRHVSVSGCRVDGVHLSAYDDDGNHAINDSNEWTHFKFTANGTLHVSTGLKSEYVGSYVLDEQIVEHSASASTATGSREVSFSGVNLYSLGVRRGDPVRVGSPAVHLTIEEVTGASTVRVSEVLSQTASGLPFALGVGDGYREERHGDNNLHGFYSGLVRSNAGNGMGFDGLYGPSCSLVRYEYHPFWGTRIGSIGSDSVIGSEFRRCYWESNGAGPMLVRAAVNMGVYHPNSLPNMFDFGGHPESVHGGILVSGEGVRSIGPQAGIKNHLHTDRVVNATIEGPTNLKRVQVWPSGSGTISVNAPVIQLMSPADLTGTPTIEPVDGRTVVLVGGTVTLHDESDLPGTKLRLATPTVQLSSRDTITLHCVGDTWVEVARAVR